MIEGARKELAACGYDPFSLARKVLPQWLDEIFYGENAAFFYRKIDMLQSQQVPRPKQAEDPLDCLSAQEIAGLTAKVALQDRTDLKFLLHSLLLALPSSAALVKEQKTMKPAGPSIRPSWPKSWTAA